MPKTFATLVVLCAIALGGCDYFVSSQTRLDRARNHVEQGNHRAALVELKNALQKDPDLHEARLLLADVALWLGDPASAEAELKRVPADVDPPAAADLKMRIALALGRGAEVLQGTAEDSALTPARRSMYRGLALLQTRGAEEAEAALKAAVAEDDSLLQAHVGVIEALIAQNEIEAALEASTRLTQEHPESAQVWFTHGVLLARQDASQALAALERARDLAPKQLDVLRQVVLTSTLIELQLASRRLEDAKASAERLAKLSPGAPITLLMTSRVAMASNDYTSAATELRRAVNAAPRFAQARFMLGVALAAQGNLEQASQELGQVVEIAPEFTEARQLLAQVRLRLDDPDGALQVLVPGLDGDGGDAKLLALVDAARVQSGAGAGAVPVLEQALAKNPGNAAIEVQLASAYLQSGAPAKALALLERSGADSADPRRQALRLLAIRTSQGDDAARTAAQSLLARRGSDPKIVSLAAAFYARLGDVDAARRTIQAGLVESRAAPELYLTLSEIERSARQLAAARAALEKVLALDPKHAPARLALAELELVAGKRDAARAQLEQARQADTQAVAPRLLLARLALADQDPKRADELVGEAVKAGADGAEVHGAAGLMYLNYGRYDQAIGHFKTALQSDSSTPPLWLNLGRAQLALNQHGPARESFERALTLRPQWLPAEGALAFLDLQLGAGKQALDRVEAIRTARPKDADAAALVGQVHFAMRRYAEAANAFDEAATLRPSAGLAADAYRARVAGNLPDPTAPLERWLQSHPEDANQRFLLAEGYTRIGDRRKAVAEYERIVAAHPQHANALNNLAWLYYELKDARALEIARRANAAAPNSPAISDTLGWLLVEAGQVESALPILEKAATQAAPDPEIVYHYGAALVRSGAVDKGVAQLRRLLRDHPSFPSRGEAERLVAQAAGLE